MFNTFKTTVFIFCLVLISSCTNQSSNNNSSSKISEESENTEESEMQVNSPGMLVKMDLDACPKCESSGIIQCDKCKGSGRRHCRNCNGTGWDTDGRKCLNCGGGGIVDCSTTEECDYCDGQGYGRDSTCNLCGGTGLYPNGNGLGCPGGTFWGGCGGKGTKWYKIEQ